MSLKQWIRQARQLQASDLHLEPGMPLIVRTRGHLQQVGEPLSGAALLEAARGLLGEEWPSFLQQRSFDLAQNIGGVRCRVNVLQSSRGVGFAIRLMSAQQPTIDALNLHPTLKEIAGLSHGLVLISGPTGSGKSSTMAAMIQEINLHRACHIVTIEHPIEFMLSPQRSLIRQREVGRDTPSVERALIDAMREDPDVIMVGEMRDAETMRLTLNAAETGHLVFATVHSSTCAEALHRMAASFSSEIQASVRAQLADSLQAVICQRLAFRDDLDLRIPECEIVRGSSAVRSLVRDGQFFKLASVMETGARDGMWSYERYRNWLSQRTQWSWPNAQEEAQPFIEDDFSPVVLPSLRAPSSPAESKPSTPPAGLRGGRPSAWGHHAGAAKKPTMPTSSVDDDDDVIEIQPLDDDLNSLIKALEKR
ncbi:MAG: PilT/PilU family type 4a pilus ATPase [Myxococcales bacterium]|nr:PilT/PilU family type 4a pilus ATPase [Myxococcales bacterium]